MENVEISECEANETSGRGGGIFLCLSDDSTNNFKFGEMEFIENNAWCGRDLFISCSDLNQTVNNSRFIFDLFDENGASVVDMKGMDSTLFDGEAADLLLFLVKYESDEVFVEQNGIEVRGCGSLSYPCLSFWRGVKNANLSSPNRIIWIGSNVVIQDEYDLSNFEVKSSVSEKHAKLDFVSEIIGSGSSSAIIANSKNLQFFLVKFSLPSEFSTNREVLISSSPENGMLHLIDCAFLARQQGTLSYSLISVNGGTFSLIRCTIEDAKFDFTPISASSAVIEACNIFGSKTENGEEGGALRISLKAEQQLILNRTTGKNCECSSTIGKGGFLFVDSTDSESSSPFVFDAITLEANKARIGEHIFILSIDLNSTVTSSSFMFDYSSMENTTNLFVGNDDSCNCTDFFRFLVGYSSSQIYISSLGFDVKRCGSEDDPCFSFWKGIQQIDRSETKKEIIIHNKTVLKDSFVLSNFKICSGTTTEVETSHSTLAVNQEEPAEGKGLIRNSKTLTFSWIILSAEFICENGEKVIVKNEEGTLSFEDCWFSLTSAGNTAQNYLFVEMVKGELNVDYLKVERVHTKRGVFDVCDGCECSVNKLSILSSTIESGSIINVKDEDVAMRNNAKTTIGINGSTFFSVSRADDGPCVCMSDCSNSGCIEMTVKNSSIESCKALSSEKGGSFFSLLSLDGSLKVEETRIAQCSCSAARGRGGGEYLEFLQRGELLFLFKNVTFSGNEAFIGRDIFIECTNISNQINETQFAMDLRADSFIRLNAIYGIDPTLSEPVDLMDLITIYQSATIVVSNIFGKGGVNDRQCGTSTHPCLSLGYGVGHLVGDFLRIVAIDEQSEIEKEVELNDITIQSKSFIKAKLIVLSAITAADLTLIKAKGRNRLESVDFLFADSFSSNHETILEIDEGNMLIADVTFKPENANTKASLNELIRMEGGMLLLSQVSIERIDATTLCTFKKGACQFRSVSLIDVTSLRDLFVVLCESISMKEVEIKNVESQKSILSLDGAENKVQRISMSASLSECIVSNASCRGNSPMICICNRRNVSLSNYSVILSLSQVEKGMMISLLSCSEIFMDSCSFKGELGASKENRTNENLAAVCRWNGSLVNFEQSVAFMKDTTISNSSVGGLSVSGGSIEITKGEFLDNNPNIEGYASARRNVHCSDSGVLNVVSLKGGDGVKDNSSLWILSDDCKLDGIAGERISPFFIPILDSAKMEKEIDSAKIVFEGSLLLPCNLSFQLVVSIGDEKSITTFYFKEDSFELETYVFSFINSDLINSAPNEAEISVRILFGTSDAPSFTSAAVLRNRSEPEAKTDEITVESGKGYGSSSTVLIIVLVIILLIVLIVAIVLAVRWKKVKNEAEDLREIVNDNIRKDPKAFEMVTMEMSPEEQWRRAEREAEKKNEERIKKRIHETNMEHSESSEHLLSESGSTEYILGRDSDKIPQWMLEKVDEKEEETKKRTPSPSISSTSTTDTSDTDTTFVRSESMCPTTSSMSNLVDAMACSSPHEKLIVDLRDSLFMLLHGRNKTKEMAIGSLQQREQTAAQILFWVANGALHSFDEMESPFQSLNNLSPHIVLFSEHMVICIVMHSDLLSDDNSDFSSISSSTVVTSASDDEDSLPSSAFEDEDAFKKECMRWKAPELLMNKKLGATKSSVAFSIGMMLWECLTLQIPFGDFEGEVAGQKIVNGERPNMKKVEGSRLKGMVETSVLAQMPDRMSLSEMKREFIGLFPANAAILTASDALCYARGSREGRGESFARRDSRIVECVLIDEHKDIIIVGKGNIPENKNEKNEKMK